MKFYVNTLFFVGVLLKVGKTM